MASFRKRDGSWEYRISYKALDGSYKQKSKRGYRTKADAQRAAAEVERELSDGLFINRDQSLEEYYQKWSEVHKKPNVSAVTWKKYLYTAAKIKLYFGQAKLTSITATHYQQVINDFAATHSQETVEKFHAHVKACAKMAVHEGIIKRNFCEFALVKSENKGYDPETKLLTMEEYQHVLEATKAKRDIKTYFCIYLIAVTGMRFAEAQGLTLNDVDYEQLEISINKTFNSVQSSDFMPTKNPSSVRTVPISRQTASYIKDYIATTYEPNQSQRLFFGVSNTIANKILKKIVGRNVHIHALRHTFASYLIAQGIELISISQLLGHKDLTTTLKVYAHQLDAVKDRSEDKVRSLF
ncbi:TPA: site-specific integrase [Streptococcus pyogenes]|uniref:site-specific integrase n=1 Tax=uncultured Streptococcus sp. TaxID=83427 RepID=UPI0026372F8F|nr:tyrosine-type recombinase/integrase [uncultured Streptococcus sp.]HEP3562741.1 site-specific integrase [Streptococcus pyogenes]HEP3987260.1 site-specific integrase [Streptococcus pyogenes]